MSELDNITPEEWNRMRGMVGGEFVGDYAGPDTKQFTARTARSFEGNKGSAINPNHYKDSAIECIDYMKAIATPEEFRGYLWLSVTKYMHRWQKKNGVEDLRKAKWYLERLIKEETL
jgi:hypothetical protein